LALPSLLVLGLTVRAAASHAHSRTEFSLLSEGLSFFAALRSSLGAALETASDLRVKA